MLRFADPLYMHAEAEFGRGICPACGCRLTEPKRQRRCVPHTPARTSRTKGHDFPVGLGGDNLIWVYMCRGCNGDQGVDDLVTWARKLIHANDVRADRVTMLAVFVRRWVDERRKAV